MRPRGEKGAALVEFALMALVLYFIFAAGIEFGRAIFVAQTVQDAARVAARELALVPLPAVNPDGSVFGFADALADTRVLTNVWNPNALVVDLDCYGTDDALNTYLNSLPPVNRALRPVFITETVTVGDATRHLMHYPGALLTDTLNTATCPAVYDGSNLHPSDLTVGIPEVTQRAPNGVETIEWLPVLREMSSDPMCSPFGFTSSGSGAAATATLTGSSVTGFSITSGGTGYCSVAVTLSGGGGSGAAATAKIDHVTGMVTEIDILSGGMGYTAAPTVTFSALSGVAAIEINYPFQSAALTGFQQKLATAADPNNDPLAPNLPFAIAADDGSVAQTGPLLPNTELVDPEPPCPVGVTCSNTYAGPYGLGRQFALLKTVRPYRRMLSGSAIFRREVISQ
jgi:hypothetical protein